MKKLLLLVGAFLSLNVAQAQYYYLTGSGGNPGNINPDAEYPVAGGLPAGWTTLFTGTASTLTTPVWSPVATVPFAFSFNGTPVTSYKVSTSGVLTFSTGATTVPTEVNTTLPDASIPDNSVLVWGLMANAGDFIITKTFGTAPNRQHWIQFNSYSHPGNLNIFTYWSIVLEETTNKIHIVDQRSANGALSLTLGLQMNATTALMVTGSPNISSSTLTTIDPTPVDNSYYTFTPGTQPAFDMTVTAINVPSYLILANAPFTITGVIKSLGTTPVISFTLNYSINGGPTVSAPVTANIATLGTYAFSHPTTWTPTVTGNYTITAWATNINGSNADMVTSNDVGSKIVAVLAASAQRTVLHEVFTSSTCGPCLPGNNNLKAVTTNNPGKSIDIKYQQDFPGAGNDQYQTPESLARRGYYAINSIPRMEVDGGWDGNASSYTATLLNQAYNKPALVSISGTHTIVGKTVTAQAVIDPMGNNISSSNLVVHMVITEKRTIRNIRTNGETEFFDVMKKMMPNQNGNAIPALTGAPVTINQTYSFPAKAPIIAPKGLFPDSVENLNNLDVTIFLQDHVTKEVFQAARSLRTNNPTGIAESTLSSSVMLYPNPSNGNNVNLAISLENAENVEVKVVNAIGQVVYTTNPGKLKAGNNKIALDLKGQANGIYFVKVNIGNKVVTKTLSHSL